MFFDFYRTFLPEFREIFISEVKMSQQKLMAMANVVTPNQPAIRTLLSASAAKMGKRAVLEILE